MCSRGNRRHIPVEKNPRTKGCGKSLCRSPLTRGARTLNQSSGIEKGTTVGNELKGPGSVVWSRLVPPSRMRKQLRFRVNERGGEAEVSDEVEQNKRMPTVIV